jgi:YD repeat-containing protein
MTYDDDGNLETLTDGGQHLTSLDYDGLNRLRARHQSTSTGTKTVLYDYDGNDSIQEVIDTLGVTTQVHSGDLVGPVTINSPDTGTATRTYNEAARPKSFSDGRGLSGAPTYDDLGRVTRLYYGGGSDAGEESVEYRFDYDYSSTPGDHPRGRLHRAGRKSPGTTPPYTNGNETFYKYDFAGRVTAVSKTAPADAGGQPFQGDCNARTWG